MIAMLMVLIYNLADTFFIGQTGDPFLVAAVSLATLVFLLFMQSVRFSGSAEHPRYQERSARRKWNPQAVSILFVSGPVLVRAS